MKSKILFSALLSVSFGLAMGLTGNISHFKVAFAQEQSSDSQSTTTTSKQNLEQDIRRAEKLQPRIKSYAQLSQNRVNRSLKMAKSLVNSDSATQT